MSSGEISSENGAISELNKFQPRLDGMLNYLQPQMPSPTTFSKNFYGKKLSEYEYLSLNSINLALKQSSSNPKNLLTPEFCSILIEIHSALSETLLDTKEVIIENKNNWIIGVKENSCYLLLIISAKSVKFCNIDGIYSKLSN